jgi:hypothetical protein
MRISGGANEEPWRAMRMKLDGLKWQERDIDRLSSIFFKLLSLPQGAVAYGLNDDDC